VVAQVVERVAESVCGCGLHGRGDWFLVISKNKNRHDPTLTHFRPEPGFFAGETLIG
jgi:hypothetical protein